MMFGVLVGRVTRMVVWYAGAHLDETGFENNFVYDGYRECRAWLEYDTPVLIAKPPEEAYGT